MTTAEAAAKIVKPYWFQEATIDAIDDGIRYIVLLGGTGAGKTWWIPSWLAYLISRDHTAGNGKGARYLAIGCTSDMANDVILPEIQERFKGTTLEGHYHISGRRYELPTGGNIYLRSAEKPYRIEGHHVRGCVLDEPSEMKSLIWPIVMRRTALHRAPTLFSGYPTNMGWYYESLYVPWTKGDPAIRIFEFPSTANPLYPAEEMERAQRTLPDWLFDMAYLGKFRKPYGLVYPGLGAKHYINGFDIPDEWPTYVIVDPAVHYGALFFAWNQGKWFIYDEYYDEEVRSAKEYAEAMLAKVQGDPQGWIYDPARLTDAVNLANEGCGPFYKAANAIRPGIVTVTGVINEDRLRIFRRCEVTADQAAKYRWPTDPLSGKIISSADKPIKKYDDLMDCLRYGLHTMEGVPLEEQGMESLDLGEQISPY